MGPFKDFREWQDKSKKERVETLKGLELDFGQFVGQTINHVPLAYLKWMARNHLDLKWRRAAELELDRRHVGVDEHFFSEHAIERFSQRCRGWWQNRGEEGIITCMRKLFREALANGVHEKVEGDARSVADAGIKWIYEISKSTKGPIYSISSVVTQGHFSGREAGHGRA